MTWLHEQDLRQMVGGSPNPSNLNSFLVSLNEFGDQLGLTVPHRLVCYVAQMAHESNSFKYDEEIWGPTSAQKRYDTRTDLGNTAAYDGDGYKNRGRTGVMITGAYNYGRFYSWCKVTFPDRHVPNFKENPDAVLTDPWEGAGPLWFWSTHDLNKYADKGDMEMITRIINGGFNGYSDRLERYTRAGLTTLGYTTIYDFQKANRLVVDGISGPVTRKMIHTQLAKMKPYSVQKTTFSWKEFFRALFPGLFK